MLNVSLAGISSHFGMTATLIFFRLNNNQITIIVQVVMHESRHGDDSRSDDITNHAIRRCGAIDERRIAL